MKIIPPRTRIGQYESTSNLIIGKIYVVYKAIIFIKALLESLHFGHRTNKWAPRMKP